MRGKNAARGTIAIALVFLVAPAFGGDDDPVTLGGEVGVSGGQMNLVRPAGCAGIRGLPASYGGVHGRLGIKSRPAKGRWEHRAVGEATAEFRMARPTDADSFKPIAFGRATFGWSSRYMGVSLGGWIGNTGENEALAGFGSLSIRAGLPERHLRVMLFDGPNCIFSNCVLGAEGLWTFDSFALRAGGSYGLTAYRGYLQVPLKLGPDLPWLQPGFEFGFDDTARKIYALTLSLTWPGS